MGVMPKMGSLENAQPEDSAPMRRPFTYTGEPLIPCATPVLITRGSVARARMTSPSTRPPGNTPTISAVKVSIESPANTVRTRAV